MSEKILKMETINITTSQRVQMLVSTIGFATGLYLAYKYKKGAWGYIGYSIGLGLAGSIIGRGIGNVITGTTTIPTANGNEMKPEQTT